MPSRIQTSSSYMNAEEMNDRYTHCMSLRKKKVGETAITFNKFKHDFALLNKDEMTSEMKRWRQLRKEGKITIADYNNETITVEGHPIAELNGKVWYSMVIQNPDPECDSMDFYGLFVLGRMIDGFVYTFDKKENRDAVYKYVMGIKQ